MRRLPFFLFTLALLPASFAQSAQPTSRITRQISANEMVAIDGGRHPMARAETDRGRLDSSQQLHGVTLIFQRSQAQKRELDQLIADLQNPASASYHKWLTPAQFGARFGMSDADLKKVTSWLESQGLTVDDIAPSKNSLRFSGAVSQVESALATQLHVYQANGETHFANASAPSVPAAMAGVVLGIRNLDDFRPKPNFRRGLQIPMKQDESGLTPHPQFTNGNGDHFLTPGDFAVIYGISPLIGASFNGTGQKIAVMGQSAVDLAQISAFQQGIGQTAKAPALQLVPSSGTSTAFSGDEGESEIDLEYAGGVAQGADVIFVYTGDNTSFNVFDALQYAIQNNTAPVLTMSYSTCEAGNSKSVLVSLDSILQQSVAQGQTIMTSSGDSGGAGCDAASETTVTGGLSANYPASSLYVIGIGGTRFNETAGITYWGSTKPVSATQYIPEIGWNDTSDPNSNGTLAATGGGPSIYFAKPSWQTGTGVPQDGFRDVPDISFAASGIHDGYIFCSSDTSGGSDNKCVNGTLGNVGGFLSLVGGTSLSAPSFAGAVAILNQKLGGPQGFLNQKLYQIAATNSSAFHDVTTGNNQVPCAAGTLDCSGGVVGFTAGAGYDLVTGLGSVDINTLATALTGGTGTASYTLSANPGSVTLASAGSGGNSALSVTPSSGFTGTVSLSCVITGVGTVAPTCSVPASVSVTGTNAATATITIGSIAASLKLAESRHTSAGWLAVSGVAFAGVFFFGFPRRRNWGLMIALLVVVAIAGGIGCSSGSGSVQHNTGTSSGTYTATITGTSGTQSAATTLTVVVP